MPPHDAITALRRFGLGPKPGDLQRIIADPRGYTIASLADKSAALISNPDLESSHVVFAAIQEAQLAQRLAAALVKDAAKNATPALPVPAATVPTQPGAAMDGMAATPPAAQKTVALPNGGPYRVQARR